MVTYRGIRIVGELKGVRKNMDLKRCKNTCISREVKNTY